MHSHTPLLGYKGIHAQEGGIDAHSRPTNLSPFSLKPFSSMSYIVSLTGK